jgi:hypothetical protein
VRENRNQLFLQSVKVNWAFYFWSGGGRTLSHHTIDVKENYGDPRGQIDKGLVGY